MSSTESKITLERFVPTKDEYVEYFWVINRRAMIREFKPFRQFWVISVILGLCIAATIFCGLTDRPLAQLIPLAFGAVGVILGLFVLVYGYFFVKKRIQLGRQYDKDPRMTAEIAIEIEDAFFR